MPLRLKLHSGALTQTVVAHARPSFPHQTIVSRLRPASTQHHSVPSLHFFRLCSSKPPPTSSHDASSNDLSHQVPRSEARSGVRSRGLRRPLIYATAFLLFGVAAGQLVRYMIVPPPLPSPLSLEDAISLRSLHGDADKIAIVQELRSRPDEWSESEAYADPGHIQQNPSLTSIAMGGSRGLGIQRVFWNEKERRVIAVVFFGGALSGWPGVAHGGAIAAILAENMARIAAGNAMDTIGMIQHVSLSSMVETFVTSTWTARLYSLYPAILAWFLLYNERIKLQPLF